jgi:hypothetical protein
MPSVEIRDSIKKKCLHWLRKQYYNVILEDLANFHLFAWKGKISCGVYTIADTDDLLRFKEHKWYADLPGQYRVVFAFPGIIKGSDVPESWGIIECYGAEYLEKRESTPEADFNEQMELEILKDVLAATDPNAPQEEISAVIRTFSECFSASGMNENRKDLVELIETGQFQYLFMGKKNDDVR